MKNVQKTALVAPLGLSPPIVTAGTDSAGSGISDLTIIATNHPGVLAGLDFIRVAMSIRKPRMKIHPEYLSYKDITTTEDNLAFMKCAIRVIREARDKQGCDRVVLNVAGARKNMSITLALIGQLMNVDGIFHIGNRGIELFNYNLEHIRSDIDRIHQAKTFREKQKIYREKKDLFNHVLFPPKSEYDLVRVPTFPVDQSYVKDLIVRIKEDPDALPLSEKIILERHMILEKGRTHYYLSDYGAGFLDAFI
ncbi:MAG: CRISPR-associated protein (Cas_NE0113) [Methanoregula sp. PtaU1.Bin051]|nr:MAG: CRISPR-associated protein (Cas_NE0113) [Methanoregula sp. PtaU1.Bin051]